MGEGVNSRNVLVVARIKTILAHAESQSLTLQLITSQYSIVK
jgi:hypothetical protein